MYWLKALLVSLLLHVITLLWFSHQIGEGITSVASPPSSFSVYFSPANAQHEPDLLPQTILKNTFSKDVAKPVFPIKSTQQILVDVSSSTATQNKRSLPSLIDEDNIEQPHYFNVAEVDKIPLLEDGIILPRINGQLTLELTIGSGGQVDNVVIEASNLSIDAEIQISEIFKQTKFIPGRVNDLAVSTRFKINIDLSRDNPLDNKLIMLTTRASQPKASPPGL